MEEQSADITELLRVWANGDEGALERLTPLIYRELRRIAGNCMRGEQQGRSMQATALVHEAYLRLVDVKNVDWEHRAHFFAVSARIMRRILLDAARKRAADKRGGGAARVNLDEIPDLRVARGREMIALDDALRRLAEFDSRKAQVIELRFFGGLSVEETATVLKVSAETVYRDWRLARAWLMADLSSAT
jgi:RNA polymerase sigma-70 factor (ECF subfamily)